MKRQRGIGYRVNACHLARSVLALALSLVFYPRAGSGDGSPLPPDPHPGHDSSTFVRNVEFEMAAINARAFAEAAQREGVSVSGEEVKQKFQMYQILYPGQDVAPDKVKTIALAEKYLERKGLRPDQAEPDSASKDTQDAFRSATPEQAQIGGAAEKLHRLLANEDMQREARKLEDFAQLQVASEHKPSPMWSQSDLQVQGDPEECLVGTGQNCIIPLQEYNAATAYYPMSAGMPLDSAKALILKKYLSEKRMAVDAHGHGLDSKADSLLPQVMSRKDDFRWMRAAAAFGAPVHDLKLLEAAYSKYYGRYFGPGEDITLALIGSSDSAYIDSMYQVFQSWNRKRAADRKPERAAQKEPNLPWSYFKEPQVSEDLVALTDSLKVGQCGPPHRTSQGRFIVRLVKATPRPEVSFEQANFRLIYLATRDKFLDMDSAVEAQARKYYAANIVRYTSPDTLLLRAWLIPRPERSSTDMAVRRGQMPIIADTARFKPMEMSSLDLPVELRIALQERVMRDSARLFLGPLSDRNGRWYFHVDSRKRAHAVMPFRLARKDILDRMTALPEEMGSGTASDEAVEKVGTNLALARALMQAQYQNQKEKNGGRQPAEGSTDKSHRNGLSESGQTESIAVASARIRAEEAKRRSEEERMLKEAGVDLSRLFR